MYTPGSSLADWLQRLETFSPHEIDLGLERVHAVLERLQLNLSFDVLHVAGTNGKGSSVALAEALLLQSERLVGSYTSPHILSYNERIRVNAEPVSDAEIVSAFERIDALRNDVPLTYFEFGTLAAVVVFDEHDVDVAILEVGMGGRLDAVNAFEPLAGLITNVSLDHCDWLGSDVETIAIEKAGIMRAGNPVVFASTDVPDSLVGHAETVGARLSIVGRDYFYEVDQDSWQWRGTKAKLVGLQRPALAGDIQISNAAGVLALMEAAGYDDLLTSAVVNRAFEGVELVGRMHTVQTDREYVLDVAHNPAAADALADNLMRTRSEGRTVVIAGVLNDKDIAGIVTPLIPLVDDWIAVRASSPRAFEVEDLARQIANLSNQACTEAESLDGALRLAHDLTGENDRIVITGSFYLVGPALEALGYNRAPKGES